MLGTLMNLGGRAPEPLAPGAAESARSMSSKNPSSGVFSTVLRILFGMVLGVLAAPLVKRYRRPVVAKVVRAGMAAGREVRAAALKVREDIEDIAAEAANDEAQAAAPAADPPAG